MPLINDETKKLVIKGTFQFSEKKLRPEIIFNSIEQKFLKYFGRIRSIKCQIL